MKTLWTLLIAVLYGILRCLDSGCRQVGKLFRGRTPLCQLHPAFKTLLRAEGLVTVEDFLGKDALIISGHPDRNVSRFVLGSGDSARTVYLKREHEVPWSVRLGNLFAGFGFVSRSIREAKVLQIAGREGIGCPSWLAAGEDATGRAFLLVSEIEEAIEIRQHLEGLTDAEERRTFLGALGRELGKLHRMGFDHPDLYSKHVLLQRTTGRILFLDWQRCRIRRSWDSRVRALAALRATVPDSLLAPEEWLICWESYCQELQDPRWSAKQHKLLRRIHARVQLLLYKRHIREKRYATLEPTQQNWKWVEGEALCVSSHYAETFPHRGPHWLLHQGEEEEEGQTQRCVALPESGHVLVSRSSQRRTILTSRTSREAVEQKRVGLILRLQRHGVEVPRVLAMGSHKDGSRTDSFSLVQPFDDCLRLDLWLARTKTHEPIPSEPRRRVLERTGELLTRLHAADCHFPTEAALASLVVVDPEGAEPYPALDTVDAFTTTGFVDVLKRERDVAMLQRWLSPHCDARELVAFLQAYRRATSPVSRGVPQETVIPLRDGQPEIEDNEGWEDHLHAGSFWRRLLRGVRRFACRADWRRIHGDSWPERVMDLAVTDRFFAKQGRSTGRLVSSRSHDDGSHDRCVVYLKRHYQLGWWHGLMSLLWPSRGWSPAMEEWHHLEWARQQDIPVPNTVAVGEMVGPGLRLQSFLAVEELDGMIPINEAIPLAMQRLDPPTFRRWKRSLISELARLTVMLHDRYHFHKDLYLCHFYIAETEVTNVPETWRGRVSLIDLHRLGHHRWTWRLWMMKDLAQLLFSSEIPGVDVRDRIHFWREYHGPAVDRRSTRLLLACILFKWRLYRRHNARKPAVPSQTEAKNEAA